MNDKPRILIVDDDESTRRSVSLVFRKKGYETETAGTGREAIEKVQKNSFNLALLDIKLPDMDGGQLLGTLKEGHPDMVAIMATAYASLETAVQALNEGASAYITKPLNMEELFAIVREALEKQRLMIENRRLLEEVQRELGDRLQAEAALAQERNLLRTLIDNLPDCIYVKDSDSRFLTSNLAVAHQVGATTPDEIAGKTDFDFLPRELAERCYADEQAIMKSGEPLVNREEPVVDHAGDKRWVLTTKVPLRDSDGQIVGLVSVNRDITERKQREGELEAIASVSAALRTAPTRAEMLPVILDQLLDLLNADGAALAVRDLATGEMVVELAHGDWIYWSGERLLPGEGISGQVIATGQPYVDNNIQVDPLFGRPDLRYEVRAVACVPLATQEQIIGALWVGRKTTITAGEVRLLTAIGDIAANAIYRATLHEQTQQRLHRLDALHHIDTAITASLDLHVTFNVILDQVTAQLGVDAADILLLNSHTQTLEYAAGRGFRSRALQHTHLRLGEGYAGHAALERRIVSMPKLEEAENGLRRAPLLSQEQFVSYYAVPLIAKGLVEGVLEIFHRAYLDPDREWLDFLGTLGGQIAIAIDNATLFDNVQRVNLELTLAYDTTLEGWARALELRDYETEGHSQRVTKLTLRLARAMGISEAELVHVRRGTLLHDIGKMGVPDSILFKPGPLTEEEWDIMRQHPVYAYEMLLPIAYLHHALDIPYSHHEKWDGTGYPQGLQGEQIPLAARIFAVVDVWDALLSDRPYRAAWSEEKALEYIREQAGKHFDPQVVEVFLSMYDTDD